MSVNRNSNPSTHFGRQMHKERVARGWSLREFAARTGINIAQASRIETGKQPPSERVALKCDEVFPERHGWFLEYYEESKSWTPPGFRDWAEYEDKATRLSVWKPGSMHGLVQTEGYARASLKTYPSVTDEVVAARLASRMERQRRVLLQDDPPDVWLVIDQLSLYRLVGSPEIMAEQMNHLAEIAAMPNVTMQVLPAVGHPANASELIVANGAAYTEHLAGGLVFTEPETVSGLARLFDTLRGECYRVSESLTLLREMRETWATGESPLTRSPTADHA